MITITWKNDETIVLEDGTKEVKKIANKSIHLFEDGITTRDLDNSVTAIVNAEGVDILYLGGVTQETCNFYYGIENVPDGDWCGYKYYYTPEDSWILDTDWVDPRIKSKFEAMERERLRESIRDSFGNNGDLEAKKE